MSKVESNEQTNALWNDQKTFQVSVSSCWTISLYLSFSLSIYYPLSIYINLLPSLSIYQSITLSLSLYVSPSLYQSITLSLYLSPSLSLSIFVILLYFFSVCCSSPTFLHLNIQSFIFSLSLFLSFIFFSVLDASNSSKPCTIVNFTLLNIGNNYSFCSSILKLAQC